MDEIAWDDFDGEDLGHATTPTSPLGPIQEHKSPSPPNPVKQLSQPASNDKITEEPAREATPPDVEEKENDDSQAERDESNPIQPTDHEEGLAAKETHQDQHNPQNSNQEEDDDDDWLDWS